MRRVRVGLLVAASVAMLAAGCASSPPANNGQVNLPPPPTAPVDPSGNPITSLCDLLSPDDFNSFTPMGAGKPVAQGATMTRANCQYGGGVELSVLVAGTIQQAQQEYLSAENDTPIIPVKQMPIGGVDESVYGPIGIDEASGIGLRRLKLVVVIQIPGKGTDREVWLIQLAGKLLSRVNALGT